MSSTPAFKPKKFVELYEKHGSLKAIARATGANYANVHAAYEVAVAEQMIDPVRPGAKSRDHLTKVKNGKLKAKLADELPPAIEGNLRAKAAEPLPRRLTGTTKFIFTSAQNNTPLHEKFWQNLLAFQKHIGASLYVSRFAYIKSGLGARGDKAAWLNREDYKASKDLWWDGRLVPYLCDERHEVAPGLVFVGDSNILPTTAKPLNGKETFTGRASGIFPHVKFAMQSVATPTPDEPTKFNFTTGTVTMRNYIQRDSGLKAEFHHCYGALLVEVDEGGNWYCRQINADSEGVFYEIDPKGKGAVRVKDGKVTNGHRIEAFNAGDNHAEDADSEVEKATWGKGGLVDTLKPKYQFFNDVCSFTPRSHHSVKDPHIQFLYHVMGKEDVQEEMLVVAMYLREKTRPWCRNIIVDSNHDRHIARWLKEQDGRRDPVNFEFWSEMTTLTARYIRKHHKEPNHLQVALDYIDPKLIKEFKIEFVSGGFVICHDHGGGIECGMHGDRGPNGSRGSAMAIAKMGRKTNIGHSHSACIIDGVYQAGTSSKLKLGYNDHDPSSWSQSHVLTYPNGKRTIVTIWNGKWRA